MNAPRRIRLYGYALGEGSFAQVTRGMGTALRAAAELAGVCALDTEDEDYYDGGADAPVSLNIGNPGGLMTAHREGAHKSHWLLLAPNSESLPKGMMEALLQSSDLLPRGMLTGGLLAPSAWAASVLRRSVPDSMPVIVAPHGVNPEVHVVNQLERETLRGWYRLGLFQVLHMTSSETERKGTKLLLRAWSEAKRLRLLPEKAELCVVMNPAHLSKVKWWCADLGLTEKDVRIEPGLVFDQAGIARVYMARHAVCQPSRGEGFGMVPLEALACGVPIIATACTGHAEYLGTSPPGHVLVEHGPSGPMDDFPGSMAPTVTVDAITHALGVMYSHWGLYSAGAEENALAWRTAWAWEKKNAVPIRQMLQSAEWQIKDDE